ncbi:MAG: DUF1828 domain-containing protein [Desulfobacteraceae bacterium]|nr:DUF1828 domain-containing protein [Desulfobacteraceae bacterium]
MDEREILEGLTEDFFKGWDVMPTGGGFLVISDWQLPNNERIEIHIRRVGEREDLFIVTDGGELINFLFSQGVDLSTDKESQKILNGIADNRSVKITEFQLVKGANEEELPRAIRELLEAVKEASFALWHRIRSKTEGSVH